MVWDREKEKKAGKAMHIGMNVYAVLFMIVWCVLAASMNAWFMLLLGIPLTCLTAYRLYVCIRHAKSNGDASHPKDLDPWDCPSVWNAPKQEKTAGNQGRFCPYCGGGILEDFEFCPKCGRRQP